jgi:hypothetical protein
LEFGQGKRPADKKSKKKQECGASECLIQAYATVAIKAGAELLTTYGDAYWK